MPASPFHRALTAAAHSILLRLVAYYAALAAAGTWGWGRLSPEARAFLREALAPVSTGEGTVPQAGQLLRRVTTSGIGDHPAALAALVAIVGALLLALPVAWVYMFTRRRKGYQQSIVHSLIILPVVVAGTVVLVKNSLALAFSIAGIIAAVRFRTTLDDSKDAVYVFLASAVGLAAAVQLDVAAVMSVLFNVVILALWYTDFARTPPGLEGVRARRQMERALAMANRTGQFVAQIERTILDDMAPAQLDALSQRIERRREELARDGARAATGEYDIRLCVAVTDVDAARAAIEPSLSAHAKRWRFDVARRVAGAPHPSVEYEVQLRRKSVPSEVLAAVRAAGAPYVVSAAADTTAFPTDRALAPED